MNIRNQLYISFEDDKLNALLIKHIQYNIHNKIWRFKYNKYRRLDITISIENNSNRNFEIVFDDKKTAQIILFCERKLLQDIESKECIEYLYDLIFDFFKLLWNENGWDIADLLAIHREIKDEKYNVFIPIKKAIKLPNQLGTINIMCKLKPSFSEYFFEVKNRKNK
jgi:hypothetical protein